MRGHSENTIQPQECAAFLPGALPRRCFLRPEAAPAGERCGSGAERLGLSGKVRVNDFLRLCEYQHSGTGERLTRRQNTTRTEGDENAANRRVFYDLTFSPPKPVSLAGFLGQDERILEVHARAVWSALREDAQDGLDKAALAASS